MASLSLYLPHFRHIEGSLAWGPSLLFRASGTYRGPLAGVLLCSSVHQVFDAPPSLLFSCRRHVGRERLWWWLHPLHMTQQYPLASMAAGLSSTGISHQIFLPHLLLISLSTVNSSLHPGIALQFPNSRPQLLCFPGDLCPSPGYVWLRQGLSDSHSI